MAAHEPHFDGETYIPEQDHDRLTGQKHRVFALMSDGIWRTLEEISAKTSDPDRSVSARLRDFRKEKFGGHVVNRRARRGNVRGLYEYQLLVQIKETLF